MTCSFHVGLRPAAQKATNPYLSNADQRRKFQSQFAAFSLVGRSNGSDAIYPGKFACIGDLPLVNVR
jgi:hypothetical protein